VAAARARLHEAHRRAERAHRRAAVVHEQAAEMFTRMGKPVQAELELEKAARDRRGAELERERQAE
jgi:hypothetical protein